MEAGKLTKLDFFFNKVLPKKLIVWIVATVLVFMKLIDGYIWGAISGVYLGVNIISKFAPRAKVYTDDDGNKD